MAEATSFMVFLLSLSVLLPAVTESQQITRDEGRQMPCTCTKEECNCCADVNVGKYKTNGCLKYKYDLSKSLFNLHALLDNISVFQTPISARNPPPVCIPVPPLSIVTVCVRIRDIRWEGHKLHVCANLELQVNHMPLIVLPFDCVYIGTGGIGVDKGTTVSGGNVTSPTFSTTTVSGPIDGAATTKVPDTSKLT